MLRWGGQRNTNLENLTFDRLVTRWTHGWMTQPRQVGYATPKMPVHLGEIILRHITCDVGKIADLNSGVLVF